MVLLSKRSQFIKKVLLHLPTAYEKAEFQYKNPTIEIALDLAPKYNNVLDIIRKRTRFP